MVIKLHLITLNDRQTHTHALVISPLEEESARCVDICLITHNTQDRQTSMLPVGFEPSIPAVAA